MTKNKNYALDQIHKNLIFLYKGFRKKKHQRYSVKFKTINKIRDNLLSLVKMICYFFLKSKMFKIII